MLVNNYTLEIRFIGLVKLSCNGEIDRLKLAVLFQMSCVGTPHICYGDEIGMMGGHDPDCRRPFNWEYTNDKEKVSIYNYYKQLIKIRNEYSSLRTGTFKTILADGMIYAYERNDDDSSIIVLINNDTKSHKIQLPFTKDAIVDLLTGKKYFIKNGIFEVDINHMTGMVLKGI